MSIITITTKVTIFKKLNHQIFSFSTSSLALSGSPFKSSDAVFSFSGIVIVLAFPSISKVSGKNGLLSSFSWTDNIDVSSGSATTGFTAVWIFTFLTGKGSSFLIGGAEAKTGTAVLILTGCAILTGGAARISDGIYTEGR